MSTRWIKWAAVAAFLQGAAHAALILLAHPTHGVHEPWVVATMQHYIFDFSGAWRSYWDLYTGYALLAAGTCMLEAVILGVTVPIATSAPALARPILVAWLAYNGIHALMVLRFFFYIPLVADMVVGCFLLAAILRTGMTERDGASTSSHPAKSVEST